MVAAAVIATAAAAGAQTADWSPRVVVKFMDTPAKRVMAAVDRLAYVADATDTALTYVRPMALGAHLIVTAALNSADLDTALARLAAQPDIDYAERAGRIHAQLTPNDRYFPSQYALAPGPLSIDAPGAWDLTTGTSTTIVAVLDTGILPHADLARRVLPGYDFISNAVVANDGDGRDANPADEGDWIDASDVAAAFAGRDCKIRSSTWHGTAVAGAIAANSNNGNWLAGLDWHARILPVRVLGKCGGDDVDLAEAIAWSGGLPVPGITGNPYPARVINMSLSEPGACPRFLQDAIHAVLARGITRAIVVAAGNQNNSGPHYPSVCDGVIAVASTNAAGDRAVYSNFGARIDIAAPGGDGAGDITFGFLALFNRGTTRPGTDTVGLMSGTSFATPQVSGVASLMLGIDPQLDWTQVRDLIKGNAKPFPAASDCTTGACGAGILDAAASVRATAVLAGATPAVTVLEYYHAARDHYFITWVTAEIAKLDAGTTTPGWMRTGKSWKAFAAAPSGTVPLCRIYIPPGLGDGHYYGRDLAECEATLLRHTSFVLEDASFLHLYPAVAGVCAADTMPVYRVFSNRADANHRYTTERAVRDQMVSQGWLAEGDGPDLVVVCAPA